MLRSLTVRLVAVFAVLAATACAPVFADHDVAGLSNVTFHDAAAPKLAVLR